MIKQQGIDKLEFYINILDLFLGYCIIFVVKFNFIFSNFEKCMMSSIPLFILGIIRLVVTTAVGYHKVVPEYGIHWNFFFTLSFTKVFDFMN